MSNILELILRGRADQLDSVIRSSGKHIETFGKKSIAVFQRVGKTINTVSDRYLNRFTGLLGGAGLLMAGKGVVDLDARLARLAITAGKGAEMLVGLKKELFAISATTYTPVGDLVDYINVIVAKTGDLDFAMKTVKDMGMVSAATGSTMADLGSVAANLKEKLKIKPGELLGSLDILNLGAKAGAVELRDFASQMEVVASATGRFDLEGTKGVRTLSAWLQVSKQSNASIDETATAIKDAIAEMLSLEKIKKMQKFGFNPIDTVASKKAGVTVMKNVEDVIKGIVKATKGDEIKLGQIFGLRSITAFTSIAKEFRATGRFDTFDKFAKQGGDGVETMKDFHFWTKQTAAQITSTKTELSKFVNTNLAKPIDYLNKALTILNGHPIITKGGLWTLIIGGGILGGNKIYRMFKDILGMGGGKGMPGAAGGLGGFAGGRGPIPVYIVNKHLSMLPGGYQFPGGGSDIPGGGGGGKFNGLKTIPLIGTAITAGLGLGEFGKWAAKGTSFERQGFVNPMDIGLTSNALAQKLLTLLGMDGSSKKGTEIQNNIPEVKNTVEVYDNRIVVKANNMDAKITVPRTKF